MARIYKIIGCGDVRGLSTLKTVSILADCEDEAIGFGEVLLYETFPDGFSIDSISSTPARRVPLKGGGVGRAPSEYINPPHGQSFA